MSEQCLDEISNPSLTLNDSLDNSSSQPCVHRHLRMDHFALFIVAFPKCGCILMVAGITPEGNEWMEGVLWDLTRTNAVWAAGMSLFWGIPPACELYCGEEHMQWSRQEDGSWVQCTRQKSCKEPSRQCLTKEIRELIFSKALKKTWEKKKKKSVRLNIATAYICTLCPFLVGLMALQSIFWLLGFLIFFLIFHWN